MKKFILIILVGIFSSCESNDVCDSECWEVIQTGNLGVTFENQCSGIKKDYVYTPNNKRFKHGDIVCDVDFN